MKELFTCTLLFCGFQLLQGQQILWAKNIGTSPLIPSAFLASDSQGNLFHYGVTDPQSSFKGFINKYDASGNALHSTQFTGSVTPKCLAAGSVGQMYVAGSFAGSVKIGNHAFASTGGSDGFVAAMDAQGNFLWVSVFNGQGSDDATGVTFNSTAGKLLVTGSVRSSFTFNGQQQQYSAEKSLFLAELDLSGKLLNHKLHDFRAGDTTGNAGLEVQVDGSGNYFLLHQREGKKWFQDSLTGPEDGIYLSKLDGNLDPAWSKFIINDGCYYGYSCRRMTTTAAGDCYVPSYCSYKYGGTGLISEFSPAGVLSSTVVNTDGSYDDLCTDGSNIYAVGTESANGCPCESNFPGYEVVRKIDQGGQTSVIAVLGNDLRLTNITASTGGMVFVSGFFFEQSVQVGNHTLINNNYPGRQTFIFALGDPQLVTFVSETQDVDMFSLYPNPSKGEIFIACSEKVTRIDVIDLAGRIIYSVDAASDQLDAPVRLDGLPKGASFVSVTSGNRRQVKKVIVQ